MILFDADLHPLALRSGDLDDLHFFGVSGALVFAGDVTRPVTREKVRRGWAALAPEALRRLRRAGIAGRAALGVHPQGIPARGLESLLVELPDFLSRRQVVAIGAIGL